MSRISKTITFSLPPEMETQVRQVMKEDDLSVSELLRQAIRLFMEEREWRRRERLDRITLALADLDAASKPNDIDLPGYRLHPLRGDLKGLWSISISGNWRITFRFEAGDVYDVDLVDYH